MPFPGLLAEFANGLKLSVAVFVGAVERPVADLRRHCPVISVATTKFAASHPKSVVI